MRKITFILLAALSTAAINSFAGDTKPLAKTQAKCVSAKASAKCPMMGGACCKQTSRAAMMMKAKPVKVAAAVKKA
jgi:hypothetical protein